MVNQETKKNINILYLSYDGMTDSLGQSQVLPYIVGLTKKGFNFHLISFEKVENFQKNSKTIEEICRENNIQWYPQTYTKRPPVLSALMDLKKMQRLSFKLHKRHPFSIVHCRSTITASIGLHLKKKFGVKFIFDMRGFWADERVEGGIWNLKNPIFKFIYNFFKRKELEFLSQSDYTISLTEKGENEILSWKNLVPKPKIKIIPCCVDLTKFNPDYYPTDEKIKFKSSLGYQHNDLILGYVGSIGTWYMLDEMLDFFKVLKEKNHKSHFLFVTGEKKEFIHEKAVEKGVDIKCVQVVSCLHKDVPKYISIFDYSIFFIRPTFSKTASSPTKQGEIMAMGVPIVCNTGVGDTDSIIQKYEAGILVENFHYSDYSKAIEDILNRTFDTGKLKFGADEVYSLEKGVKLYAEVYQEIIL
jgi:glycosyltransferase involved in cell wall biosynthesis